MRSTAKPLIGSIIHMGVPELVVAAFLCATSVAVITPPAWAMYCWIERPGVSAGRQLAEAVSSSKAKERGESAESLRP